MKTDPIKHAYFFISEGISQVCYKPHSIYNNKGAVEGQVFSILYIRSGGSEGSGATPFGGKCRAKEAEVGISLSAKPNEP